MSRHSASIVGVVLADLITVCHWGCGGESAQRALRATPVVGDASPVPMPGPVPAATLTITTVSLPDGSVLLPYSAVLQSSGGTTPVTWTHGAGFPAGLSLRSDGLMSGTPTAAGVSLFDAIATDSSAPPQPT